MAAADGGRAPRSATGPVLLPASHGTEDAALVPLATSRHLIAWSLGRGTVFWRIWPAVLVHTLFAALVVALSLKTNLKLGIPNVMLTVVGVVIGFVISYRASSGYDRYWQGRSAWSDLARTSRTFSRLIWIHIPLKLSPDPPPPPRKGKRAELDLSVARRVMAEKRTALNMIEGFVVAVKHHLRGEMGIYYEDLYPLVKPLHKHAHHQRPDHNQDHNDREPPATVSSPQDLRPARSLAPDPVIPPINAYGTFPALRRSASSLSSASSDRARHPLLPGAPSTGSERRGLFAAVSGDLVPFGAFWRRVGYALGWRARADEPYAHAEEGGIQRRWRADDVDGEDAGESPPSDDGARRGPKQRGYTHAKHRPRLAGGGENLPLEILRALSVWVSVLDERGVVPGSVLGGMYGCLAAFEDSLCTLERILTTPLPFVYSAHIRHTVWLYLFFLPFQLVELFRWYAIPGVAIAAFIYLGLVAAGEEIEQPFGYDENDLDLDFFCAAVVRADIERLRRVACPNVFLDARHHSGESEAAFLPAHEFAVDPRTSVEAVFGGGRHA